MNIAELKRFIISIEIKALEKTVVDGEGESQFSELIRDRIANLKREGEWIHQFDEGVPISRFITSDLVIRRAITGDVDTIRDVYRRASLTNEADHQLIAAHPEWLVWDVAMLPFAHVAVVDGRVVGFASARPIDDFLELEDLFTDPDYRRQGVASALIADIARRGLRIEVSANHAAKAFYESVGFVVIGIAGSQGGPVLRMHLDVM
ncbi:GNAT family N-acetyltransferase [Paenibacillus sp. 5J-6]|uniref:GNAT family N-acetyltransferase n=1 Tax=Paenibacillus silvestris TaxID=2606219 RepID=A0A6L8V9Z2_9BACL|nr:GNAT family N-acetyltransferase [Paenibacillus silvestris]MZQ86512.1 GNAT family N-acetyltransferase [Paenibacillus silvestris]